MSAAWQDGFIKANGLVIHFTRTGGNKPPVILNHGALDDGLCWTRVAKTLQEDYDLIMLDARGHGLSEIGHGDYSSVQRAADIAEVVRALGLNRPVIGGHSLGADAAMHLAAIYPDLPRAIFLEDPPVTFPGQPIFGGKLAEGKNPAKLMVAFMRTFRILPTFLGRIAAKKLMPTYPDDEINPWLASKKRCSRDFIKSMTTSPLHSLSGIPHKLLSQIKSRCCFSLVIGRKVPLFHKKRRRRWKNLCGKYGLSTWKVLTMTFAGYVLMPMSRCCANFLKIVTAKIKYWDFRSWNCCESASYGPAVFTILNRSTFNWILPK